MIAANFANAGTTTATIGATAGTIFPILVTNSAISGPPRVVLSVPAMALSPASTGPASGAAALTRFPTCPAEIAEQASDCRQQLDGRA
jgi:hypothetical protein